MSNNKYKCPCCGYYTFDKKVGGTFDICPVCYWEDDNVQLENTEYPNGANPVSLNQAKLNYNKYGAISKEFVDKVREPNSEEIIN